MSFTLTAPIPLTQTTTVLPNPEFGDSEAATVELNILRTVNGRRRTYVKTKTPAFPATTFGNRRRLQWTFTLTRNKALELFEFYRSYNAQLILIKDHNNRGWVGYIVNNPFEISMERRGLPTLQDWPAGETCETTIEFEGARTSVDLTNAKIFVSSAQSVANLSDYVFIETTIPVISSLKHNWDTKELLLQDNAIVDVWPDIGYANNDLIGKIGGLFEPTADRRPNFRLSSVIFPSLPTVSFENLYDRGNINVHAAAMITTSNTSVFPNRRGTIFWVWAHTISNLWTSYLNTVKYPNAYSDSTKAQIIADALADRNVLATDSTEYGLWGLQNTTLDSKVEQVHVAGGYSSLFPVDARFQPVDSANDLRLATAAQGSIPAFSPTIYTLSRDSNTTLRFRTNGIERAGATILNNPGYTGKLHINNQPIIPQYASNMRGEWAQIMIYDKALTTTQMQEVERYLSLRWGIPLNTVEF